MNSIFLFFLKAYSLFNLLFYFPYSSNLQHESKKGDPKKTINSKNIIHVHCIHLLIKVHAYQIDQNKTNQKQHKLYLTYIEHRCI